LILFSGVGGTGTTVHYLTLVGLVEGALLTAAPESVAGFTVGTIIKYILNTGNIFNRNTPLSGINAFGVP